MKTTFDKPKRRKFKIERFSDGSYTMTFRAKLNTHSGKYFGIILPWVFSSTIFAALFATKSNFPTYIVIFNLALLVLTYRNINRKMKIQVVSEGVICGVVKTFGAKDGMLQYLSKKNIAFSDVSRWDIARQDNKSFIYALVHGEQWNVTGFISHELAEDLVLRMEGNSQELNDILDDDLAASIK